MLSFKEKQAILFLSQYFFHFSHFFYFNNFTATPSA